MYCTNISIFPIRGPDPIASQGGSFGVRRGKNRKHKGIDLCCYPGTSIWPIETGLITKIGYPYEDHLEYRYVEITPVSSLLRLRYRYFYVDPEVVEGQEFMGGVIGTAQDLTLIYPGITNHIHLEILEPDGNPINPMDMYPHLLGNKVYSAL